jgi:hypothetical protein
MPNTPQITQNFARPSYRTQPEAGIDPDMRRMAIVAAGFGGALALVIGAVSLSHPGHHGVPVIAPPPGPVRVKPLDPGGMKVAGADDDVTIGAERLAPPAEQPELRALRAKIHAKLAAAKPPAQLAEAQPAPAHANAPAIAPSPPAEKASVVERIADNAIVPGAAVQIGAFDSEQAAEQDWGKSAEKMPELFDGHKPQVVHTELAGHTIWRLRTGGFASIAAATEFCQQVRSRGGDCSIASF